MSIISKNKDEDQGKAEKDLALIHEQISVQSKKLKDLIEDVDAKSAAAVIEKARLEKSVCDHKESAVREEKSLNGTKQLRREIDAEITVKTDELRKVNKELAENIQASNRAKEDLFKAKREGDSISAELEQREITVSGRERISSEREKTLDSREMQIKLIEKAGKEEESRLKAVSEHMDRRESACRSREIDLTEKEKGAVLKEQKNLDKEGLLNESFKKSEELNGKLSDRFSIFSKEERGKMDKRSSELDIREQKVKEWEEDQAKRDREYIFKHEELNIRERHISIREKSAAVGDLK